MRKYIYLILVLSACSTSSFGQSSFSINDALQAQGGFTISGGTGKIGLPVPAFQHLTTGDINGDNYEDLLTVIDPYENERGFPVPGGLIILYGSEKLSDQSNIELAEIDSLDVTIINGLEGYRTRDIALADINNDGLDDIFIGQNYSEMDIKDNDEVRIIYGQSEMPDTIELSVLSEEKGFKLIDKEKNSALGFSLERGDLNNDDIDDIIIGAPIGGEKFDEGGQQIFSPGIVYVLYGRNSQNIFPAEISLDTLNISQGYKIIGPQAEGNMVPIFGGGTGYSYFTGFSVSSGDLDGDNLNDLIIGSRFAEYEGKTEIGLVTIIYGSNNIDSVYQINSSSDTKITRIYGISEYDLLGTSVATGDVNGDGLADLTMSATGVSFVEPQDDGEVYTLFGKEGGYGEIFDLTTLNGTNGVTIKVARAEDLNNDGYAEIIASAPVADGEKVKMGYLYLLIGKEEYDPTIDLFYLSEEDGIAIHGPGRGSRFSLDYEFADINGDGLLDLMGFYQSDVSNLVLIFGTDDLVTSLNQVQNYPTQIQLNQNYPNPFNPSTQIQYTLPEASRVRIQVNNTLGQRVALLVDGQQSAGTYTVNFDAPNLSSGMYFYSIEAGDFTQTRKMLLIK